MVVTNCLIHDINKTGESFGIAVGDILNCILVSNTVYNVNDGLKCPYPDVTNLVMWGNDVHDCNTDCIQGWAYNYFVVAYNRIHDTPENGNHNDAMQILQFPDLLVIAGNTVSNVGNSFFIEPYTDTIPNVNAGNCYIFNNIRCGPQAGTDAGLDDYGEVMGFYVFNNTWVGSSWDNSGRSAACYCTNAGWWNNINVNSDRGKINFNTGTTNDDFNYYSNSTVSGSSLADFQSAQPAHEQNSISGDVFFVNFSGGNFRVTSGVTIGKGTNLTAWLPDLTVIPAKWRPDPSKDFDGVARGSSWDIGAFQGTNAVASSVSTIGTMNVIRLNSL